MSVDERKDELIKGIEHLIEINTNYLKLEKQQFDKLSKEHLLIFSNWRNYILAGVSFATPLFVSLAQVESLENIMTSWLIQLLAISIPIGLGSFFILNVIKNLASIKLGRIVEEYLQIIDNLYFLRGFLGKFALHLDIHKKKEIDLLEESATIVAGNRVGLWNAYEEASKSILLWGKRKALCKKAQIQIDTINEILELSLRFTEEIEHLQELERLSSLSDPIVYLSREIARIYKEPYQNKQKIRLHLEQERKTLLSKLSEKEPSRHIENKLLNKIISSTLQDISE